MEQTPPQAKHGETVYVSFEVQTSGWPWERAAAEIRAYNEVTGEPIQLYGTDLVYTSDILAAGEIWKADRATVMVMPNKPITVRFTLGEVGRAPVDLQRRAYQLIAPIIPPEQIEAELLTPEEQEIVQLTLTQYHTDLDEETQIIYTTEQAPAELEPPPLIELGTTELPWFAAWLEPLVNYMGSLIEAVVNFFAPIFKPLEPIGRFFGNPIGTITEGLGRIFTRSSEESINTAMSAVDSAVGESPEWKEDLDKKLTGFADGLIEGVKTELAPDQFETSPLAPSDAATYLTVAGGVAMATHITSYIAHVAAEASTLGQLDGVGSISGMVLDKLGLGDLSRAMILYPLEPLLLTPARQHYMSLYTPEIPSTADLINMVVKEVIDLPTFKLYMSYQGLNETWSQRIWDAHFIAPSLGQILTSFRRGKLTADDVKELQILVDLDPRYDKIWLDQWYNDPSITQGRFMFETGAIDRSGLRDIIVRSGLDPTYVDSMTDFVVRFQERLWRRRYLIAMAGGYRAGVYTAEELTTEILGAGYTEGVARWMIATEDVRAKIAAVKVKPVKRALINVSMATDAYIYDDVDEEWLRDYFTFKGYDPDDIDIALKVFARKKAKKLGWEEVTELRG